jgi:hypothetical protein
MSFELLTPMPWPTAAACSLIVLAVACVYRNALPCGFAFDDAFAITYNGDVTDPLKPLASLLEHDFWGQDIRGEGSHKSFRRGQNSMQYAWTLTCGVAGRSRCSHFAQTGYSARKSGGRGLST